MLKAYYELLDALGPKPLIRHKTTEERDAENRWWAGLSEERKREWLDRMAKEDRDAEAFRAGVFILVAIGVAIEACILFLF